MTWEGDPAAPFANLNGTVQIELQPTSGPAGVALFVQSDPSHPQDVLGSGYLPQGFMTFIEGNTLTNAGVLETQISGTTVSDHEWKATVNLSGAIWNLDFSASSSGYTVTATHSEKGRWQTTGGHIHMVADNGATTDLSYSTITSGRLSVTESNNEPAVLVRS